MKLIKGNNRLLILVLVLASACQFKPESDLIKGKWKYESITKDGQNFIALGENDILELFTDSFKYDLEKVGKHMSGKWTYSDHTLHLQYNQPDTIRHFPIDLLSGQQLKFHEGNVQFVFKKIQVD